MGKIMYSIPHEAWNELNQRHADLLRRNSELQAEREELRGEVAALREGYRWILGAANAVQEGKTSEAVALIAIEDFANYSLAAVPADARGEDSQNDSQNSAR